MKHQKIIDDLMKIVEATWPYPSDIVAYRAAREFRIAEAKRDNPPWCAKPVDHMNVHKTYFDSAGRERDGHGHIVMRAADGRLAEDAKVREQVADIYRATIEKFFGLWEGSLVPHSDDHPYVYRQKTPLPGEHRDWITSNLSPKPTWVYPPPNYSRALRWPGLYQ